MTSRKWHRGTAALDDVLIAARLLASLRAYFRNPIDPDEALAATQIWIRDRGETFLTAMERHAFGRPGSPYHRLFGLAGCELGDLRRLVVAEGLEGALAALLRAGIYVTVDEFKGRRSVVRGSASFHVEPDDFAPPLGDILGTNRSSGSRGSSTVARYNLHFVRMVAVNYCAELKLRGGLGWVKALWDVPGGSIGGVLRYSGFGAPLARWFSLVDTWAPGIALRYRLSEWALHWGGVLAGVRLPRPEFVPMDDPLPLARWLAEVRAEGRTPHVYAFLSPVVRLCQAAERAGLDIAGSQFSVTGETLTASRAAVISRVGATAVSRYGSAELGILGVGCQARVWSDEHHVPSFRTAIIQAGDYGAAIGLPPDTLLGTSLRPSSAFVVVNLSSGDQATLFERDCGCPLQSIGLGQHLRDVRSFEKLTAAGMTFLDADLVRLLEAELPARFGGGPTDYQLVEQEAADGSSTLRLRVDPSIGPVDPEAVAEAILTAIARPSGTDRIMSQVWRTPGFLQVERRPPLRTSTGKILHVFRVPAARSDEAVAAPR
jgi:hypothetical protein